MSFTLDKGYVGLVVNSVWNLEGKAIQVVEPLKYGGSHYQAQPGAITPTI